MSLLSCVAFLLLPTFQDSLAVGGFAIQGVVVSEGAARSASGITVLLFKSDGTTVGQTRTDDTGKFRFHGLTKGSYEVVLQLDPVPQRGLKLDASMSEAHFLLARVCRQVKDASCAREATARYRELRTRERQRVENDRVLGILFTLGKP